jgi:hypothetical protein
MRSKGCRIEANKNNEITVPAIEILKDRIKSFVAKCIGLSGQVWHKYFEHIQ